jgi:hypothetical protein
MKNWFFRSFSTSVTKHQVQGSGMAVVLILLIIGLVVGDNIFYKIAIGALVVNMVYPMFYYPFAIFWYGLSNILGAIFSKILLMGIYLVIVMPVALFRQMMGKDPLLLKEFKKEKSSVMKHRNRIFTAEDLEKPF